MNNVGTSYVLWALGFLGFAGLHRFYNRKYFTGFLWMMTGGLFFVGQFIDLLLIPGMVNEHNAWVMFRRTFRAQSSTEVADAIDATQPPFQAQKQADTASSRQTAQDSKHEEAEHPDQLMLQLLRAAKVHNGCLTVTQGVMDTGYSFSDVESTLREMVKTGYIAAHNDPVSGILIFDFLELSDSPASEESFGTTAIPQCSYPEPEPVNRIV